ncbi:MAG TPA: DUF2332 domain-containing protein [Roseomonas sp.]|jgi:hypothetical protein
MDAAVWTAIAARYRRFAVQEARGRSPLYEALAEGVAGDPDCLRFLASLPEAKQQPNLLLAAVRHLHGTAAGWEDFRRNLLARPGALRAVMLARATQTNEPARCATLLPVLARLPQPIALIEVGASAGLCLLLDRYGYDYGRFVLPGAPVFACAANAATPLPAAVPQVIWRAGLDLNPLDITDPDQRAWLETLVWPGQPGRLARLRAAMAIAAEARPRLVRGDLRADLARLAAEAPRDATLVIFHTAVLSYVASLAEREAFAADVTGFCDAWIANEAPAVFPSVAARAGEAPAGRFLLSLNGAPLAWTDPHGAAIDWVG